jgi:hypothetical protein
MITIPKNTILTRGSHSDPSKGQCARELLHMLVTGQHANRTPECLTACCAVLPPLNDSRGWRDDRHRTDVMVPWVERLAECPRDAAADQIRVYRLADVAVRVIAAEVLDAVGLTEPAARLRALAPIVDRGTADDAADDAAYAAAWTAAAAYTAAYTAADVASAADVANAAAASAAYAAADVANAAAWTVRAAAYAARRSEITRLTAADVASGAAAAAADAAYTATDAAAAFADDAAAIERYTNLLMHAVCDPIR